MTRLYLLTSIAPTRFGQAQPPLWNIFRWTSHYDWNMQHVLIGLTKFIVV